MVLAAFPQSNSATANLNTSFVEACTGNHAEMLVPVVVGRVIQATKNQKTSTLLAWLIVRKSPMSAHRSIAKNVMKALSATLAVLALHLTFGKTNQSALYCPTSPAKSIVPDFLPISAHSFIATHVQAIKGYWVAGSLSRATTLRKKRGQPHLPSLIVTLQHPSFAALYRESHAKKKVGKLTYAGLACGA